MADKKEKLPKVPPFVVRGTTGKAVREPVSQPRPASRPPTRGRNGRPSERGMLSVAVLLISAISLGIAMMGGAWIAYGVLTEGLADQQEHIIPRIVVVGLAYMVGWIVSLFGVRSLGNFILPYFIKVYAWITLTGVCVLQIAIISKLFKQAYSVEKFFMYMIMFVVGLIALIGLHLITEKHNLVPFSFPILFISLAHLYLIVFHYIFVPEENVKYEKLWGDVVFFITSTVVSVLMLAHFGLLNSLRSRIDVSFDGNNTKFIPEN
jgi:hypothetical protein